MTSPVVHHLMVLTCCALAWPVLVRARWTWRSPRVGVVLWQLWYLALTTVVVGLPVQIALAPYDTSVPGAMTAVVADLPTGRAVAVLGPARTAILGGAVATALALVVVVVTSHRSAMRTRRRHIAALSLVTRRDPAIDDALLLDHPAGAAYCVPGTSVVVVSAGVVGALDAGELAAVMAHERAHLRARHDIALLPFAALRRALPRAGWVATAAESVALLVEMCADDAAVRRHGRDAVRSALMRVATIPTITPPGALGATSHVTVRIQRLNDRRRPVGGLTGALLLVAAFLVATTPLSQLTWPA